MSQQGNSPTSFEGINLYDRTHLTLFEESKVWYRPLLNKDEIEAAYRHIFFIKYPY